MKNMLQKSKNELNEIISDLMIENLGLINENNQLRQRIDAITSRLDEAIEAHIKISSRLINAKNEYRKLRDEYDKRENVSCRI